MAKVYSVKAGPAITRIREGMSRRRAGVEFSATARLVSTSGSPGVVEVSKADLEAILEDEHLLTKEVDRPATEGAGAEGGEELTAKDLQAKLAEASAEEAQAILEAEQSGKKRKTVIGAAESRLAAIAEEAGAEGGEG